MADKASENREKFSILRDVAHENMRTIRFGGQRTRIIQIADTAPEGLLTTAESAFLGQDSTASNTVTTLPDSEVFRARKVQAAHLASLLKGEGIQGVAITSSADDPSEAALLVLVIRGSKHEAIPAVLDGLRTRIRESTAFRSGLRSTTANSGCERSNPARR